MITVALEESRQPAVANTDSIRLANAGHVRLFTNEPMVLNTIDSAIVNLSGYNSLMLVVAVDDIAFLLFMGRRHAPDSLALQPSNSPNAVNDLGGGGPGVFVWSWGAFTTIGGGSNQDSTMMVWGFFSLEVSEYGGSPVNVTVDLFAGKR